MIVEIFTKYGVSCPKEYRETFYSESEKEENK